MPNILSKVLLLIFLSKSCVFVWGSIEELPPSVISSAPLTRKQLAQREEIIKEWQEAREKPLVRAAGTNDQKTVRFICLKVPKGGRAAYNYYAFLAAVYAGHNDVARYLAYGQPACKHQQDGDPICYDLFWRSILLGNRHAFDFLIAQGIDAHYVSAKTMSWMDNGESEIQVIVDGRKAEPKYLFRGVHVNAMSYLRAAYYFLGETPELRYMYDVLISKGVTDTPPLDYHSNDGGCCDVQ
jgi:hypothetical protein